MLEAYPARWSPPHERYFRLELRAPKGPKTFFCALSLPCLPGRSGQRKKQGLQEQGCHSLLRAFLPARTRYHPGHPGSPPSEGQGGCSGKGGWFRWYAVGATWSHHPGPRHVCGSGGIFGAVITAGRGHDVMSGPVTLNMLCSKLKQSLRLP